MRCLVIGHLTHDIIIKNGRKTEGIGGGVYYSSLALSKFCEVVVLTKVGKDFPIEWLEELESYGISTIIIPSEKSTTYELLYLGENTRQLKLLSRADSFTLDEIPKEKFDLVLLNPVANEIPQEALSIINAKEVVADVQGFLRGFENDNVVLKEIDGEFLKNAQVVHADAYEFQHIRNLRPDDVEVLLISNGAERGVAYHRGKKYLYHPLKIDLDDPTGAGDVFLASFAYFYMKCPFVLALKRANAFTATFLERRSIDFPISDALEKAKFVKVEKVDANEETSAR
ncbi:PfkB family carbohydrate kinase [Thermococcus aggregans]|uniref:PfkB family carbohydrate kinase n=1 Tax=Thermococcus aggregans TaxID=110163 RepID=A0A9E7SPE5_THEAG|nr:PfkB family carbohydrate kinase [Thermococcus aggregans]USS41453.1 PfkB family carbohydrate kinase [Thermococcus aggregans]